MPKVVCVGLVVAGLMLTSCSSGPVAASIQPQPCTSSSQCTTSNTTNSQVNIDGFANDVASPTVRKWFLDHSDALETVFSAWTLPAKIQSNSHASAAIQCSSVVSASNAGRVLPAIPNTDAQTKWSMVVTALVSAADLCSGVPDSAALARIKSELNMAANSMAELVFGRSIPAGNGD